MCTVSYIPKGDGLNFILTSNRDERVHRNTLAPQVYTIGQVKLAFPKDELAGGSWIAAGNYGRLACLLNGALIPHEKQAFHTHSRGKVLVDLVASKQDPMVFFSHRDLSRTEPFTVVTIDLKNERISGFTEFIWDGSTKQMKELNPDLPHFWSSVTLYSDSERKLREKWFKKFLGGQDLSISPEQVMSFHSGRHTPDERVNLVMRRDQGLKTVSITQVKHVDGKFAMKYLDLVEDETHIQKV
ncbi:MAG: NRDE family protein [Bacteroidales bacterium]|nr:NRDE family protein [Bacteroidales bacterium]